MTAVEDEDFKVWLGDFTDFLNELEEVADKTLRGVRKLKVQISKLVGVEEKPKLSEETFNVLKWQSEKGSRLGVYEIAYRSQNVLENWQHCFNILKANNATIANSFHEESYQFRYWIYPEKYDDRIFRKKLNKEA